jgi:hypothetical protein
MIDALRVLQYRITGAAPSDELAAEASRTLTDLAIRLGAHAVDEAGQIAGRMGLPGREPWSGRRDVRSRRRPGHGLR